MNPKNKRAALQAKAKDYQQALNEKVEALKTGAKEKGGHILLGAGILAGGYLLYHLLGGSDHKKKEKVSEESGLGNTLSSLALALALSIAKEKLLEYLEEKDQNALDQKSK